MPKSPYTYPHKSREAKVAYLCSIGGYSNRDSVWPLEFNVATYRADLSFDNLWNKYSVEHMPFDSGTCIPTVLAEYYVLAKKEYAENENNLWEWGQEDAARGLMDSDTYQMLWDGTQVRACLSLQGRCGKHLVLLSFNGRSLEGIKADDLEIELMRQTRDDGYDEVAYTTLIKGAEWAWSTEEINLLYKYVRQCEVDFTVDKASQEVEYCAAFTLFSRVNTEWEIKVDADEKHEAAVAAATALHSYLRTGEGYRVLEELRTLCEAAGVDYEVLYA